LSDDEFARLVEIMARLRGPDGCPWDKEQTSASIAPYCLEEAFEVVEAIDEGDPKKLCEELGDLILQVVFHAEMAKAEGRFTINDVLKSINEKLIRRHPHVFRKNEVQATTSKEVLENWSAIKKKEGRKNLLDGIPKALPALLRATRMGEKAATVGFDWKNADEVWPKLHEEMEEIRQAGDASETEEEFGDFLFAAASLARHLKIDPESALRKATEKFDRRFRKMEEEATRRNVQLKDLSAAELDELWNQAKMY
jgi:tetrapyrrole methylase family protein / MazG family protein